MSIHSSAMLCSVSATRFGNSRKDKKITAEVTDNNQAAAGSAKVTKELLPKNTLLEDITKVDNAVRKLLHTYALPWDGANWLLPTSHFMAFRNAVADLVVEREGLVRKFCVEYPNFVLQAAKLLGTMYNALDYPHPDDVPGAFSLNITYSPIPTAGDFRVDVSNETVEMLKAEWLAETEARLLRIQKETWERVSEVATSLVDRLADPEDGERMSKAGTKIFRDTLVENANTLVGVLEGFNFTKDPDLIHVELRLRSVLSGVDADALRNNTVTRHRVHEASIDVLNAANAILDRFTI